ncbi:glutathione synthetase ATP-binding domain-like protein [Xylariaceae sp. FL1651]|nr:glutathione synthetase ATP-binding domain-like protein [Xylariaceae sp. FL1651]
MSEMCTVTLWAGTVGTQKIGIDCSWKISPVTTFQLTPLQTVDIIFSTIPDSSCLPKVNTVGLGEISLQTDRSKGAIVVNPEVLGSDAAFQFLKDCLGAAAKSTDSRIARLVIPLQRGTIIRSDIFPLRLRDAFWVEKAASFSTPLQVFPGSLLNFEQASPISLIEIFRASAGAVLIKPTPCQSQLEGRLRFPNVSNEVEVDFGNKLAVSWISSSSVPRKRLVLVGCSNQDPAGGGWTQFAHHAALALGIDLVIIDRDDGWLAQGDYSSWYEALLPASAAWWADPSGSAMADEIVELVENYKAKNTGDGDKEKTIDGIVTFTEAFQVPVSQAASRLGLPHEPSSAFETATNKHKLGMFQGRPAFLISSADEVLDLVDSRGNELGFPLIIKPCFGLNSEGVSRVDKASEVQYAIEVARNSGKSRLGGKVLVERYCDGPEVDVNMVFVDGEVMFEEICDDFPKGADVNNVGTNASSSASVDTKGAKTQELAQSSVQNHQRNFHETTMMFPSALPIDELIALRNAVKSAITSMGFKSGVMHVEARIAQSRFDYRSTDGIVDLRPRHGDDITVQETEKNTPSPWIIEVNPRPPGLFASQTPQSVYGIDYWGISLLLAVGDKARAAALSRPFAGGAQSHTALVLIRADFDADKCEGIFDSDDVCAELVTRRPELGRHISRCGCLLKRGQKIPHPREGRNTFIAYFNISSRTSRLEALSIAETVRREVRYEIR